MALSSANWRKSPVVRLLSSIRFGVTIVALTLVYACVMSALPQVRGALEMTEMSAFGHWLFVTLIVVLMLSITVATLSRIRFHLINAGVLTVHAGLLLLCGGALWYFGLKIEGDVLLNTPQIQLTTNSGQQRALASLLPEVGQSWSSFMPAFGGAISMQVEKITTGAAGNVEQAVVRAQLGTAKPVTIELTAGPQSFPLGDRLWLHLATSPAARKFYDHERPALYVHSSSTVAQGAWNSAEIRGLPLFRERYGDDGYVLNDAEGRSVPSKRFAPAIKLGPISVPTGWFERWQMPIRVPLSDLPFDVDITGYVPYVNDVAVAAVAGGDLVAPAMAMQLAIPGTAESVNRTLFALDPANSVLNLPTPIEFRWAGSIAERDALLTPLVGSDELLIEVINPPATKRVAIAANQTVVVDGTPYKLKIQQLSPSWPMMSAGFAGATSPAATVAVECGELRYTRTVIQRFPDFSQDIDEKGQRHREGPYDPNLRLRYRTASSGWLMIVADAESATARRCEAGLFEPGGKVTRRTLTVGESYNLVLPTTPLELTITSLMERARRVELPVIEPLERRRPNIAARAASAIRLKFTGRGNLAGWSESQWCLFSDYPGLGARPIRVSPPNSAGQVWEVEYSRLEHDLGAELTPGKLAVKFFPGKQSVESWSSFFSVRHDNEARSSPASVATNTTYSIGPWTLYQSGAAADHWSYTVLGVGNRMGIGPMVTGCIMITLGSLFAFYVKPALRRRREAQALAVVAARGARHEKTDESVAARLVRAGK